jgi:hypothetical protein
MAPFRMMSALLLLLVCVLLAAGCIGQPAADNRSNNVSVNVTTFTSSAMTVQTQCPVPVKTNSTIWLTINPIADHHLGDIFEVNGTIHPKNLTVENAVKIYIDIGCYSPGQSVFWPNRSAILHPSDCEVKTWSYKVNLSVDIPARECMFTVYTKEPDSYHRSTRFNVTPRTFGISVGAVGGG